MLDVLQYMVLRRDEELETILFRKENAMNNSTDFETAPLIATPNGYISGQPLAFTIYLNNGYATTISSVDGEPLTCARQFAVKIACIDYRYLKLDAKLSDREDIILNPKELIICLNTVLSFTKETLLVDAEYHLRHNLNKTL